MSIDYGKIKDYWNNIDTFYSGTYSPNYRIINDEMLGMYRFKAELSFILKALPTKKTNFLDIGCGTGNFIAGLKDKFDNVIGLDFSKEMVKISQERFRNTPNVTIIRTNILDYISPEKSAFDLILIGEILLYLQDSDIEKMLLKLKKTVERQSVIIIRETVASKRAMIQERDSHLAIRRTLSEYCLLFNKSGFDVILVSQNMYYNYAGLAGLYRRKISILKRLRMSFFENKLVEVLLLWVPYKILSIFKKNLIVNYFFILKPR
jgi:ubiquinone/menaquinone biosynthesis C-methylase UbiE